MEKTIMLSEAMFSKTTLKTFDARAIGTQIVRGRQQFEPDGIQLQPLQSEHPLERNRKGSAAVAIFCRETAAEENGHRGNEIRKQTHDVQRAISKAFGVSACLELTIAASSAN